MARERCWALSDCLISADRAGSKGGGKGGKEEGGLKRRKPDIEMRAKIVDRQVDRYCIPVLMRGIPALVCARKYLSAAMDASFISADRKCRALRADEKLR